MKCVHSERNESNRKEARDLTAWMAHHLSHWAVHHSARNHDTGHAQDSHYHNLDRIQP